MRRLRPTYILDCVAEFIDRIPHAPDVSSPVIEQRYFLAAGGELHVHSTSRAFDGNMT